MQSYEGITVKTVSTDSLVEYENNPRKNDGTVEALARAIRKYGFNQPIVVDKENVIVKGHTRYRAAKLLGMEYVPVIVSQNEDSVNNADRVLDNKIHDLSKWDPDALALEMRDAEDAITEVIGSFGDFSYETVSHRGVTAENIQQATAKVESSAKAKQSLIAIQCEECGEIMYLSRTAVENL